MTTTIDLTDVPVPRNDVVVTYRLAGGRRRVRVVAGIMRGLGVTLELTPSVRTWIEPEPQLPDLVKRDVQDGQRCEKCGRVGRMHRLVGLGGAVVRGWRCTSTYKDCIT